MHTPGPVESLARLALQTEAFDSDPDFRDAVHAVLGISVYDAAPDLLRVCRLLGEWAECEDDDQADEKLAVAVMAAGAAIGKVTPTPAAGKKP